MPTKTLKLIQMDLTKLFICGIGFLVVFSACHILVSELSVSSHPQEKSERGQRTLHSGNKCGNTTRLRDIHPSKTSIARTVHLEKINYVQNGSQICTKSSSLQLLVLIVSSPENYEKRKLLRNTWTTPLVQHQDSAVGYFIGLSANSSANSVAVGENRENGDMVIVNFQESYRNLSLKTVLMLKWVRDFCPNVKFVLKCDDDMFINVYNLIDFIKKEKPVSRSFYGRLRTDLLPVRDEFSEYSKWLVTDEEYAEDVYPDFVSGPSYLLSTEGISDLFSVCLKLPYLYLEDVFVTGICAKEANYCRRHNAQFLNDVIVYRECIALSVISVHEVYDSKMFTLWKTISNFDLYKSCVNKPEDI